MSLILPPELPSFASVTRRLMACFTRVFLGLMLLLPTHKVLSQNPEILSVYLPDMFPIGCHYDQSTPPCMLNQLVKITAAHSGLKFTVEVVPFPRLLKSINEGSVDLAFLPRNDLVAIDAEPIHFSHSVEIVLMTSKPNLLSGDKHNKRVPLLRGLENSEFHQALGDFVRVPVLNLEQMLGMFAKDRLDVIISTKSYLEGRLPQYGLDPSTLYEPVAPKVLDIWLYCRPDFCDPMTKEALIKGSKAYTQGDIEQILLRLGQLPVDPSL